MEIGRKLATKNIWKLKISYEGIFVIKHYGRIIT